MSIKSFIVVLFEDGVDIIPKNWFNREDCTSFYPNFEDKKLYNIAVKQMMQPRESWKRYKVHRVFTSTDSFEVGLDKMKEALEYSDLTSDAEARKVQRRVRARRNRSSSDDFDLDSEPSVLPPAPAPPTLLSRCSTPVANNSFDNAFIGQSIVNRQHQSTPSQRLINTYCDEAGRLVDHAGSSTEPTGGYKGFDNGLFGHTMQSNSTSVMVNRGPTPNTRRLNNTYYDDGNRIFDHGAGSSTEPMDGYKNLEKLISRLDTKINLKFEQLNATIDSKLQAVMDSISRQCCQCKKANDLPDYTLAVYNKFPVRTEAELLDVEQLLTDASIAEKLKARLGRVGGVDCKSATISLLKKVFKDVVAKEYSWVGGKAKKNFSALLIVKMIIDIVSEQQRVTQSQVEQCAKGWLRHAHDRFVRSAPALEGDVEPNVNNDNNNANN